MCWFILQCAKLVNVSYTDIMECLNGKKGVELQLKAEKKTHTIAKPYPSFIPTIVYEEVNKIIKIWKFLPKTYR